MAVQVLKEDGKYYFVKFFANWCGGSYNLATLQQIPNAVPSVTCTLCAGHCKTLAPSWGRLAAENNNTNIEFLQVECGSNKALCDKAAVCTLDVTKD